MRFAAFCKSSKSSHIVSRTIRLYDLTLAVGQPENDEAMMQNSHLHAPRGNAQTTCETKPSLVLNDAFGLQKMTISVHTDVTQ